VASPKVQDLRGLWRRSLIVWPDGVRDITTEVRWLQGIKAYIDLRQPASLPHYPDKRRLLDLSLDDCTVLARQEGFAGSFTFDGAYFEWARAIDFQPKPLNPDSGSLRWDGEILIERGRAVEYLEHWHRDESTGGAPAGAISLRAMDSGIDGLLLRVGTVFMFARDRSITPTAHKTLPECIAQASSLQEARALIDCEISFGMVRPEGFVITASSLPYRVGDILDPRHSGQQLQTMDRAPAGNIATRHWEISEVEGDLDTGARKSIAR